MTPLAIQEHAAIGDGRSAALVARDGSLDWLCWPRFDSPSLFAAILDGEVGGCWRVGPRAPARARRAYVDESNVLTTRFEAEDGRVRLTDLMPVASEEDKKSRLLPEHELLRVVECEAGAPEIELRFEPRPDYGRRRVRLRPLGALGVRVEDGAQLYTLRAEIPLLIEADRVVARARLQPGQRVRFSLAYDSEGPAVLPAHDPGADEDVRRSVAWWRDWAGRCTYQGPYRAQVVRSLLALKLLSYAPSGAIVAAPTTSLPERVGGPFNWDYRFCWVRDASLTVRALFELGYADEAGAFVSWLLHSTTLTRPRLCILYDVFGELPAEEEILPNLRGHRESRPVRLRNAATTQLQLDGYGEVIDAVATMARRGVPLDHATQDMVRQLGDYVCAHWWRPDQGIWEPREAPTPHTHSRLLAWVAADRLLELHRRGALRKLHEDRVAEVRTRAREQIESQGWNPQLGAYTQILGGDTVDASLLLMGYYGFRDPREPRLRLTYERIHERLHAGRGLLYRNQESRASGEGAFGACGFWAAHYLAQGGGSLAEAERYFEDLLSTANDVGLFSEEVEPGSGEALGNFPQAFTHVGLINAALALEQRRLQEAS